jgi:peptidoglycan hydrolase CwlO-like protein
VATYPKRSVRVAVAVISAAVLGVTLLPSVGEAAPQLTLAQAQAQLNTLENQAEAAQEQVNTANVALAAGQKKLAGINARVAVSQKAVDAAERSVGQIAANAYRSGGVDTTLQLLTSDDPTQFLAQASELDGVARHQGDVLIKVTAAKERLAQDKLAAAQLVGQLQTLRNSAATNQAAVNARKADAQRLLDSLEAQVRALLTAAR